MGKKKKRYYEVRLLWWSIGWDSMLARPGSQIQSLVRELDPRATAKSLHATAKRSCVPLLRPGAANWIDKDKYFSKKYYGVNTIVMDKKSNF